MNKETIAAIISDRTIINDEGLVQNAEEVPFAGVPWTSRRK